MLQIKDPLNLFIACILTVIAIFGVANYLQNAQYYSMLVGNSSSFLAQVSGEFTNPVPTNSPAPDTSDESSLPTFSPAVEPATVGIGRRGVINLATCPTPERGYTGKLPQEAVNNLRDTINRCLDTHAAEAECPVARNTFFPASDAQRLRACPITAIPRRRNGTTDYVASTGINCTWLCRSNTVANNAPPYTDSKSNGACVITKSITFDETEQPAPSDDAVQRNAFSYMPGCMNPKRTICESPRATLPDGSALTTPRTFNGDLVRNCTFSPVTSSGGGRFASRRVTATCTWTCQ